MHHSHQVTGVTSYINELKYTRVAIKGVNSGGLRPITLYPVNYQHLMIVFANTHQAHQHNDNSQSEVLHTHGSRQVTTCGFKSD